MFKEIFERTCKEHEWDSIEQLLEEGQYQTKISLIELACKEFSRQMCDKQKQICSNEAELKTCGGGGPTFISYKIVNRDSILNTPYPEELL